MKKSALILDEDPFYLPMYYFLLIILTILFATIAWRDVRHGIFLIAAALPAYLLRFDLFGLPMTMLEVMVLIVLLRFVILRTTEGRTKNLGNGNARSFVQLRWTQDDNVKKWLPPVVLLLLAATIGIFVAPDHLGALGIWKAYFVEPILFFFVIIATLRDKDDLQKLFLALGAGALFVAVFAIFQFATGLGIPEPWDVERRVTSIFPYPNAVGLYLGPIIVLGVFLSMSGGKKIFWLTTSVLSFAAIIFAQSEAAIVAVVATLFIASLLHTKLRLFTIPLAAIAVLMIAALPMVRVPVFQKLALQDYSGQVRMAQWRDAIEMLKDRPLFGAGLSGYPEVIKAYHSTPQNEIFQYPHNIFLNSWSELGLLGLLSILVLAWAALRHRQAAAAFAALCAMAIHGLVDVPYFKNDLSLLTWILFAVLFLSPSTPLRSSAWWQKITRRLGISYELARVGQPLPPGRKLKQHSRVYLESICAGRKEFHLTGTDDCPGIYWRMGPFRFEAYTGDMEPTVAPEAHTRLVIWDPVTRTDRPAHWWRPWMHTGIRQTGAHEIKKDETYWKNWSTHAQRHRKRWLAHAPYHIEEAPVEEFIAAYRATGKLITIRNDYFGILRRRVKTHPELLHLYAARDPHTQKIMAGLAVFDLPDIQTSEHLIAFFCAEAAHTSVNYGLIDRWFQDSIARNIRFLDFGIFWAPGDPRSFKGFSKFKKQFDVQLIRFPCPLLRLVWGKKE